MKTIRNTLYVTKEGAYLHKDGEAIIVRHERKKVGQFPVIAIGEIVCFGFGISVSPALAEYAATSGTTITYVSGSGKFLARMVGPLQGNVLLRRQQYRDADDEAAAIAIARCCVAAKTINQRTVLRRFCRNHSDAPGSDRIRQAADRLDEVQRRVAGAEDLPRLRAIEGEGAACYFGVFDHMRTIDDERFAFNGRRRRPPTDRINALLSFTYSLLSLDLRSALEAVGLDPYVGYLHVERPGRPSLALDLMEEFRAPFADRLVLSLVNRGQIAAEDFTTSPTGEVEMKASARKTLLAAYQKRKRETIRHPFLDEEMEVGVAFIAQARLLARCVRRDLDLYPAFLWR